MSSIRHRALGAALVCAVAALAVPAVASAADTTPPVSVMTTIGIGPNAEGWSMGNRKFTVDATDDSGLGGVKSIEYEVVATGANALPVTTYLGFRLHHEVKFEGYYTFRWRAIDQAGNAEDWHSASYKVDSSGPVVSNPTTHGTPVFFGDGVWWKDTLTINATATDPILQDGNQPSGIKAFNAPMTISQTTSATHTVRIEASDVAGHEGSGWIVPARVDADPPVVSVTGCPAEPVAPDTPASVSVAASDVGAGIDTDPTGTYTLDTSTPGVYERSFAATDGVRHSVSASCSYEVLQPTFQYAFSGFFRPVSMDDVNAVNAGRSVPVKFSLGGDQGMDVIEPGYPRSVQVACSSIDDADAVEPTTTPGSSGLTYDAATDQYQYVWKTDSAWAGQCRQFVLTLTDGSTHRAYFRFR